MSHSKPARQRQNRRNSAQRVVSGIFNRRPSGGIQELSEDLLSQWGGIGGFARSLKQEFDVAESGSVARQRILSTVVQVAMIAHRNAPEKVDDDNMTDEELSQAIKAHLDPDTIRGLLRDADKPVEGADE